MSAPQRPSSLPTLHGDHHHTGRSKDSRQDHGLQTRSVLLTFILAAALAYLYYIDCNLRKGWEHTKIGRKMSLTDLRNERGILEARVGKLQTSHRIQRRRVTDLSYKLEVMPEHNDKSLAKQRARVAKVEEEINLWKR
ncbi:hypothetical protein FOZ63_003633 [Perkinsus olseni]|uniref:Uncharacterized protein n=2 Tax=Perkinsus olseni TaxID=32597 RepID=A0A7J6U0M6_PEROL|nr:hypothetical protein FOZ63_003633 [Perkinsus olseni]